MSEKMIKKGPFSNCVACTKGSQVIHMKIFNISKEEMQILSKWNSDTGVVIASRENRDFP